MPSPASRRRSGPPRPRQDGPKVRAGRNHASGGRELLAARTRKKATDLERFADRITSCRVTVAQEHERHRQGILLRVRIALGMPGKELAVSHAGPQDHAHEDVQVAIGDAFDAVVRRLEDQCARAGASQNARGPAPWHRTCDQPRGRFGFVDTAAGEVYFHLNSMAEGDFGALHPGGEVRLEIAERESAEGWHATTVRAIGKHHLPPDQPR